MKAVGDDRGNVQTRLNHRLHHIPGLIHLSTVDALDGEAVKKLIGYINEYQLVAGGKK